MTTESVSAALRYMENVELPFSMESVTELVKKMRLLFIFMGRFDDVPIDVQNKIANWLIQVHMFKRLKQFLARVMESYPLLFASEVGDEVKIVTSFKQLFTFTYARRFPMLAQPCSPCLEKFVTFVLQLSHVILLVILFYL